MDRRDQERARARARPRRAHASVAAALWLRVLLTEWVGSGLPTYLTFYPAIMVVALLAGIGPGLLATALADGALGDVEVAQLYAKTFPRIPFASSQERASPISSRVSLTGERQSNRLSDAFAHPSRRRLPSFFDANCWAAG